MIGFATYKYMGEIKFRAWETTQEDMYSWKRLSLQKNWWDRENYLLMQYTGLKDKNGKEIYEGDICKSLYGYKSNKPLQVVFEHGCFFLRSEKIASATSFQDLMLQDFEVIGNIYENPELITSERHALTT